MKLTRREALEWAGWTGVGLALGSCKSCEPILQQIANRPMRRDITTLADSDPILQAYRSAVTQMKALPAGDRRNWNAQAEIHNEWCTHRNWLFLPWHRVYLWFFEEICRELT